MKYNSQLIKYLGLAGAAITIYRAIDLFSKPPSAFGVAFGMGMVALGFASIVTLLISKCLKTLEDRLSKIENNQPPKE